MWPIGTKVVRQHSLELGVGVVVETAGRFVMVFFPDAGEQFQISPGSAGTVVVNPVVGEPARRPDGTTELVTSIDRGMVEFEDGERVEFEQVWPIVDTPTLWERLRRGSVDSLDDVKNRVEGLILDLQRRGGGVPSLIGGRVELFPHQLATAARALEDPKVRWLLADEVGLGKTVTAAMIMSAMIRTGRVESVVVVAPDSLSLQWLGELYRKFHQIFVHVDSERIAAVDGEFGAGTNVFDIHPLSIVSMELLAKPRVRAALADAVPDLLVIDEAHRAEAPLEFVPRAENALLLTSSAFARGATGFEALTVGLRLERQSIGPHGLYRHVSAVSRSDLPAMPKRVAQPVDVSASGDLTVRDARAIWLADQAKGWHSDGSKSLVFVNTPARAMTLQAALERLTGVRVWVFHEEMASSERDIQLAEFRASGCPLLVSSGAGSEGRNFQFCDRVVHVDLAADPLVLEQRTGRVDRLGRIDDIEVVYFNDGSGGAAELYEELGLFEQVVDGTSPALEPLRRSLRGGTQAEIAEACVAYREMMSAEHPRSIFPDSFDPLDADAIEALIPTDSKEIVRSFVLGAATRTGIDVVEKGRSKFYFEYGSGALVDAIPGVTHGSRYLGTFSRTAAIFMSEIDFFASGHPLVEGLVWELDESDAGRVASIVCADVEEPCVFVVTRASEHARPELIRVGADGDQAPAEWDELLTLVSSGVATKQGLKVPDLAQDTLLIVAVRPE